jgi:hypothetical protein
VATRLMDVVAFYGIMAGLSFTLLGLWWVACLSRREWVTGRLGRGMAYVVSMHFVLPGAMSLLALVAPELPAMWRITFTTAGVLGVMGTLLIVAQVRRRAIRDVGVVVALQWVALPLYTLVAAVAALPEIVGWIGLTPIQVEATLLVILIVLGTQSAWLLTFARPDSDPTSN